MKQLLVLVCFFISIVLSADIKSKPPWAVSLESKANANSEKSAKAMARRKVEEMAKSSIGRCKQQKGVSDLEEGYYRKQPTTEGFEYVHRCELRCYPPSPPWVISITQNGQGGTQQRASDQAWSVTKVVANPIKAQCEKQGGSFTLTKGRFKPTAFGNIVRGVLIDSKARCLRN